MVTRVKNVSGSNIKVRRALKSKKSKKGKAKRQITDGIVHLKFSFNNTIVTVTDLQGNTITFSSGGCLGFKGTKKSTPYAAQLATESALRLAMEYGLKNVRIRMKGAGAGREMAIRTIQSLDLNIEHMSDVTPIAHNKSSRLIRGVRK